MLATYIDLDSLTANAGLSEQQQKFVDMLMEGFTLMDIAEIHEVTKQAVDIQFRRAVQKIVQENNRRWHEVNARVV